MRKHLYLRGLAAVAIITSGVLLGACNKPAGGTNSEEGATHIKIFTRDFEDWENQYFADAVNEFNADLTDGIQVDVEFILEDQFNDKMTAAREAGNAPDIFLGAYNHIYNLYTNKYCAPLNDYIAQDKIDDIADNVKDALIFDNKLYAYPFYDEPSTLLFYHKSMLQAAGVTEPSGAWTWAQLLDACAKIKPTLKAGTYPLGMPLGGDIGWATWGMCYNQMGEWPITDNWDASTLGNHRDEMKRFLDFYGQIYDNGYSPVQALNARGYNDIVTPLCANQFAMTLGGSWTYGTIKNEYPDQLDDIGAVPLPTETGDVSKVTATNGGWCFLLDSMGTHKDLAAKFLNWYVASDDLAREAKFFELGGFSRFSARKSVAAYIDKEAQDSIFYQRNKIINEKAMLEPLYPWDISVKMATMMETMIVGLNPGQTTDQLISDANTAINNIISARGLAGTNPHHQG
jgi:multiple sugar transport system substrate-binding protein